MLNGRQSCPDGASLFSVTGQSNQGSQEQAVMSGENFSCFNRRGGMCLQMPRGKVNPVRFLFFSGSGRGGWMNEGVPTVKAGTYRNPETRIAEA